MRGRHLVTGATGFLGRNLCARLLDGGSEVHAIVRPGSDVTRLDARVQCHSHDGTTECMVGIVQAVRPVIVFHMASKFLARHQPSDLEPLIRSNVLLGSQLLDAMALAECARLVNVGTAWQHFEASAYDPVNLYAATKKAFEDIARYYHVAHRMSILTLEISDTYGPGDTRRKLLNLLTEAQASGQTLRMSPGLQQIDLVYVDDVVAALCCAATLLLESRDAVMSNYRVSSGQPLLLREVVASFEAQSGTPVHVDWGGLPYRQREMMDAWSGGEPLPGWRPTVSLEEGLRRLLAHLSRDGVKQ